MNKSLIFLVTVFLLLLLYKCHRDDNNDKMPPGMDEFEDEDEDDDDNDDYGQFKTALKEYLKKKKLTDSDKIIKRKRLKKIFIKIVAGSSTKNLPKSMIPLYEETADYFLDQYYKKKEVIRGKDIYKLFNFDEISLKFNELYQKNPPIDENDKNDINDKNYFRDDL